MSSLFSAFNAIAGCRQAPKVMSVMADSLVVARIGRPSQHVARMAPLISGTNFSAFSLPSLPLSNPLRSLSHRLGLR